MYGSLSVLLLMLRCTSGKGDLYTSTSHLDLLVHTHAVTVDSLQHYVDRETARIQEIQAYLDHYKREQEKASLDVASYVANPINTYTLIKRLTADLDFIISLTEETTEFEVASDQIYPDEEDLNGAMTALTRIQAMYRLNTTEIANGVLSGTFSHNKEVFTMKGTPMSASDCYEIGKLLYDETNYKRAVTWLIEAYCKCRNGNVLANSFTAGDIVELISNAYFYLEDYETAAEWSERLKELPPTEKYSNQLLVDENRTAIEENIRNRKSKKVNVYLPSYERSKYGPLCRGEISLPVDMASRLTCSYLRTGRGFLTIAPIKMEQLNLDPEVFLFHEVMNDDEIEHIKILARPKFSRSQVNGPNKIRSVYGSHRVSKSAWLSDKVSGVVSRITRRVRDFTGLNMETAEDLQVANYGTGGHFGLHTDFVRTEENLPKLEFGDRVATTLFYMSDVELGGATVFPRLGMGVFPKKGAALFWWNQHPSGEGDLRTLHAACPVVLGAKWVANKWIRLLGQEFVRPCTLEYQREGTSADFK